MSALIHWIAWMTAAFAFGVSPVCGAEPDWWTQPPVVAGMVVGVGQGSDADQAHASAIAMAVSSLAVDVSSERTLNTRQISVDAQSTVREDYSAVVKTRAGLADLPGAVVAAQIQDQGHWYCQIHIPEAGLLDALAIRLATLAPQRVPRPTPPTWQWVQAARVSLLEGRVRDSLCSMLTARGRAVSPRGDAISVLSTDLGACSSMRIGLVAEPGLWTEAAMSAVGATGLQVIAGHLRPALRLIGKKELSRTDRGWHRVHLETAVTITWDAIELGGFQATGDGVSTTDPALAERVAASRLQQDLNAHFSSDLLPILLAHQPE